MPPEPLSSSFFTFQIALISVQIIVTSLLAILVVFSWISKKQ